MARLIPSFMDDRTPPGERDVFNLLAAAPVDWVAVHSLDLSPWNNDLRTEVDFVVIMPDAGILCVEVKSHPNITFDGHRWYPASIRRSPFKQAVDGSSTFRRRLVDLDPGLRRVPVMHCCIFPRAPFDLEPNLSVQPWELMDSREFTRFRHGSEFCADLRARMLRSIRADRRIPTLQESLTSDEIDAIVALCVPVQRWRPDMRHEIEQREREAEAKLRDQQRPVLKLAATNPSVVVSGGAGTGKTLIAMEVARRAAESGRRVALVCFNQLIGDWIRDRLSEVRPALPQLVAGRAIRVLAEMTGVKIPADPSQQFWENELPQQIGKRLSDPEFKAVAEFDCLIVDEAQDILARRWIWQSLLQLVPGIAAERCILLFGDFENQVLTERAEVERALAEFESLAHPVRWPLSENCRNYRIVGDTAVRLAGLDPGIYSDYLRGSGEIRNYDIYFYADDRDQLQRIGQWLREFREKGYKSSEVTLLSFAGDERSAAARLNKAGIVLRPARSPGDGTSYASVHAYKGMENKAIILTDVSLRDGDSYRSLFYTGVTRATEYVRIACESGSRDALQRWLEGDDET